MVAHLVKEMAVTNYYPPLLYLLGENSRVATADVGSEHDRMSSRSP